ncbi:MAG: DUF3179 domain-containing (seleno)protein [Coleofasciculus sp. B1-GNL1-01]|uniref:DUF3179 domain-containing (seleno)protein n=1 Tax=Coleofasciculus sp. B1-GNL1-01 TaxID=3068484 RepID=UPI003300182B
MIYSIVSFILGFTISFGRQISVFAKLDKGLWFFQNYEVKRIIFTSFSLIFAAIAIYQDTDNRLVFGLSVMTFVLLGFAFLFDMTYLFPEIDRVDKTLARCTTINETTRIIGLTIGQTAIAYPLDEVVIPRHIINDEIEHTAILISYCALCQSALAFKAEVGKQHLYFKVAGVWRRNMIMIDKHTQSLWQQATGECIYGTYKGTQLELLSGENTTWGVWRGKHPDSLFAEKCFESRHGILSRELMLKALNFVTPKVTMPGFADLSGLPQRETVFGISFNGVSKAYPLSELNTISQFTDNFNGKNVELVYDQKENCLAAKEKENNQTLIVEKHWWLGWKEFHPNTEIWRNN